MSETTYTEDGALSTEVLIDYRFEPIMPELGMHGNYEHVQTLMISPETYETANLTITREYDFSVSIDFMGTFNGTNAANQDDITDGVQSHDDCLIFWANNISGSHYHQITGLPAGVPYRVQGMAYVPTGQTNVNGLTMQSATGGVDRVEIARAGQGWVAFDRIFTPSGNVILFPQTKNGAVSFTGANLATNDRHYLKDLVVSPATGKAREIYRNPNLKKLQKCALVNERVISTDKDRLYFERVYAPAFSELTAYGSENFQLADWSGLKSGSSYGVSFDAPKQHIYSERVAISAVGEPEDQEVETSVSEVVAPQGTLHYASSVDSDGDFTTDLTQTAADIQDDIPVWYDNQRSVVKEGSKVTITAYRSTAVAASIWTDRESIYVSGLPAGIGYTITGGTTSIIIEFFKTTATAQGTLHYASTIASDGDLTVDLSLDAADILAAVPTWYDNQRSVVKEGSKVTITAYRSTAPNAHIWTNRESIYVSGLPAGIGYTITGGTTSIIIEFFDSNPSKTTLSTATAVRKLTAAGHDITAGADVAIWNGDTLLGATYAVSVSGNDVYVPIGFLGGKNNTATHIGKNASRTTYGTGNKVAVTKSTIEFFTPGFTPGITTADDILAIQGGETAQALLDAAVAGATTIKVAGSRLTQIRQRMFAREAATMKAGAILI